MVKRKRQLFSFLYTSNAAPSAPYGLTSTIAGPTWLQISWYAPYPTNGVISYYTLVLNSSTSSVTLNTSSSATTLNVTGLSLCTYYWFAVSATTGCGVGCTGPLSYTSSAYTAANSTNRKLLFTEVRITVTYSKEEFGVTALCCSVHALLMCDWWLLLWTVNNYTSFRRTMSESLCALISEYSNVRDMAQLQLSRTRDMPEFRSTHLSRFSRQFGYSISLTSVAYWAVPVSASASPTRN